MNAFEMGKWAALEDLCDYADEGASMADCLEVINETVNTDLDKYASEEDVDFRLGIESFCYDFLKEAAETYGTYDVEDVGDYDLIEHVMDKVAKKDDDYYNNLARGKMTTRQKLQSVGRRVTSGAVKAKKGLWDDRSAGERAAIGGGTLAAGATAAGAALGARKGYKALKKKYKERKAKKAKGQKKDASDHRMIAALEALDEAGLLDD